MNANFQRKNPSKELSRIHKEEKGNKVLQEELEGSFKAKKGSKC